MIFNGTRLGSFVKAIFYLAGAPIFKPNGAGDVKSLRIGGGGDGVAAIPSYVDVSHFTATPHPTDPDNVVCYGVLGCIRVRYAAGRGFHLFPEPLTIIKPEICLHLHSERNENCQLVEVDSIQRMLLSNATKSYWVAHGYIETNKGWIQKLMNELLDYEPNANVFTVSWPRGAEPPYRQAVVNIELIGSYVGHIMTLVQQAHGIKISEAHFIGHSLGAHMGGFLGSWLQRRGHKLGRISGLDPAQPFFESFPPDIRLDPSDAHFVDVIHTDAKPLLTGVTLGGLGTQEPSGHVDFYPNNGRDQPGCADGMFEAIAQEQGSLLGGVRRFLGCDHIRAYEYFTESIRSNCSFMAFACPSWRSFAGSACSTSCDENPDNCNRMGFYAKPPGSTTVSSQKYWSNGFNHSLAVNGSILYYSMVGTRSPYCREHIVVTLKLSDVANVNPNSDMNLVLFGKSGVMDVLVLGARDLRGGSTFQYTLPRPRLSEPIKKIVIKSTPTNTIWWLVNRVARSSNIEIESLTMRSLESWKEKTLCPVTTPVLSLTDTNSVVVLSKTACER